MSTGPKELAHNATRWATVAKKELPEDVGFVFLFFPRSSLDKGKGVFVSNLSKEEAMEQLRATLRRYGELDRILIV